MVMAPTMVMITLAIAEMMALIPPPIAETMEPCKVHGQQSIQVNISPMSTHHFLIVEDAVL